MRDGCNYCGGNHSSSECDDKPMGGPEAEANYVYRGYQGGGYRGNYYGRNSRGWQNRPPRDDNRSPQPREDNRPMLLSEKCDDVRARIGKKRNYFKRVEVLASMILQSLMGFNVCKKHSPRIFSCWLHWSFFLI